MLRSSIECGGSQGRPKPAFDLLPHSFFSRDTVTVARELLGHELVREISAPRSSEKIFLRARIVETEAYLEQGDPAAHCSRGPTPRAKVMFGLPGTIYVYFIYGNYYMLNFVTEPMGKAGAVLIRAVEPLEGTDIMAKRRGISSKENLQGRSLWNLTNGPAKLVLAFGIDKRLNGTLLGLPKLAVVRGERSVSKSQAVATTRVGISVAKELPFRFYEKGSPFVSRS